MPEAGPRADDNPTADSCEPPAEACEPDPRAEVAADRGQTSASATGDSPFRSGFVSLIGRPNAGKSTLLNRIVGSKVSIVSDKPQTTRSPVRAVLNRPGLQLVFVDTPGIHKPRTALGSSLNASAGRASSDADVVCFVLDARAPFGRGDEFIARSLPENPLVVVTKIDRASPEQVLSQLAAASKLDAEAWFCVSGRTGEGVVDLIEHIGGRLPEGPRYFPDDVVSDVPSPTWVAELVREQLLANARLELPYSIATRVTDWDWPRVRVEILVERESQKAMVIGRRGRNLKRAGSQARRLLPEGVFLELFVRVEPDWQQRPDAVAEFGY